MDRVISLKPVSGQHGTMRLRTWEVPDVLVHNQIHVIDRVRDRDLVRTLLHEDFNLKLSTDSIKLHFIAVSIV
ncbi:hypothetical protein T12_11843 [Trichinella patagoniensis]|uniref:Uncharacterized protein n=1 Tax=Trichinella patagoniensis TaxID=990121 RepID=A0A0V0Z5U1_9BILA|nr:hypothetical protein T12_11843 [Trichinella patagoniensis]